MAGVLHESYGVYREKISLVVLFSIPFIIAFAIPLLAPLPTYVTVGAIFLRSASIFVNGNISLLSLAVITISTIFSLLFLSFAFVLISLLVKSKRTHLKIGKRAFGSIEAYVGRVFTIFLIYTIAIVFSNMVGYFVGKPALLAGVAGLILFAILFYAPSAVVVDDKSVWRSIKDSARLVVHEPQYFILWLVLITIIVSIVDAVFIFGLGTNAGYPVLVINSLFIVPYFVIFQAEAYMNRFKLLRH